MKKKISIIIAFTLCLSMLSACGGNADSGDANQGVNNALQEGSQDENSEQGGAQNQGENKGDTDGAAGDMANGASNDNDTDDADDAGTEPFTFIETYFDFSEYDDETHTLYFECNGNHVKCTVETGEAYPGLSERLNNIADDEERSFKEIIDDNDEYALEFASEMQRSESDGHYSRYANDLLKRADDKCVSLLSVAGGYLGGAHPDYYFESHNIDPLTGSEIALSDVIKDEAKLKQLLNDKLVSDYPDVDYFDLEDSLSSYSINSKPKTETKAASDDDNDDITYEFTFTLDPDGIAFYFSPYEVSAYAYGSQVVKILYDEAPGLFKADYSVDDAYISYLSGYDNKYALDGETADNITVESLDYDDYGTYLELSVNKNGESLMDEETYYFDKRSFVVHTEGGADYVYVVTEVENDYKCFYVCGLDKDNQGFTQLTDAGYTYNFYDNEEKDVYGRILPIYPDDMDLAVRCDLLSTYSAYGRFRVADDGTLERIDDYLAIPYSEYRTLTSIAELTADIVDEDGRVADKDVTISKGEEYTLYRTDGIKVVDAKLSDGRIVRMNVSSNYPHIINNEIDENELFETLYYAG